MKRVQLLRHSPQDAEQFTGGEGEVTVELENFALRVHDGQTAGGYVTLTRAIADALYVTQTNFDLEIAQIITDLNTINDDATEELITSIVIARGPVLDIRTGPPVSPAEGDRYLIASGGTSGAYVGHEDEVVEYIDDEGTAIFSGTPAKGHEVYVIDEAVKYYYTTATNMWTTTSVDGTYLTRQTAIDAAIALKANIASPTFTGVPAAPTAAPGTDTTQLATTAFVEAAVAAATVDLDQDLSSSGFQYLPGGGLLQWGFYAGGSSNPTIVFPEQFPNACFSVVMTPVGLGVNVPDSGGSTPVKMANLQSFSDTSFAAYLSAEDGVTDVFKADTSCTFFWMAFGN